MNVLVTGGAGYIGSHTTRQLLEAGYGVTVLDNLYSGHRWAVPAEAAFYEGDIADRELVERIIDGEGIEAVILFAGHIVVPESVSDPLKYYQNNVAGSLNLIQSCVEKGVERMIFSSSAAVYGMPEVIPISEEAATVPINPYGTTKLVTEWMLRDVAAAEPAFRYVALRYFNVAGAHLGGELGQTTPEATHLIKVACEAACGARESITVFGSDYPTPDGTCIRDYIHVEDLARAHLDALAYLEQGGASDRLNCGYGRGYSVREVIAAVREASGVDFAVIEGGRRAGDPPELVADNRRIREVLGWAPRHDDLGLICRTAYEWECKLQQRRGQEGEAETGA